eukprot:1161691-Pelagomonas_calceolata.AAC.1
MNSFPSCEHRCAPFLAKCRRVRQLACDYKLADRPHTMLYLTKPYDLPACMYASQIWGTRFMRPGAEMDCPLQTVHLCLLKRILEFYHASLTCNSINLRKVIAADVGMSSAFSKYWASEFLSAFEGLDKQNSFAQYVYSGQYAYKLSSIRCALEKTPLNSRHQGQARATPSNPPDFFLLFLLVSLPQFRKAHAAEHCRPQIARSQVESFFWYYTGSSRGNSDFLEPRLGTKNTRAKPTRKGRRERAKSVTKKDWRGRSKGPLGKDRGAGAKRVSKPAAMLAQLKTRAPKVEKAS